MEALIKQILLTALLSSAMIAAVLLVRRLFRDKLQTRVISLLWFLAMVRLMLPVTIEAPFHVGSLLPQTVSEAVTQTDSALNDAPALETGFSPTAAETMTATAEPAETETAASSEKTFRVPEISLWQIAFAVWALGAAAACAITLRRMGMFLSRIKARKLLYEGTIAKKAYLSSNVLGIYRNVFVYECEYIDSPITCGVIRPKILLPRHLIQQIGESKTGLILFHELVHVKRQDVLKNYLWMLAKIVYWFNPLVYLGSRAFLEDIEMACDEVVKKKHSREQMLEYSQGLLDVIRLSQGEIVLPTAISFCKDTTKIRKRVENMLKPKRKSKLAMTAAVAMMMVFTFGCFTSACMPEKTDSAMNAEPTNPAETQVAVGMTGRGFTPVGSEENALAIVEAHNLNGAKNFRYDGLSENVLPFHMFTSEDGTDTMYQIYDFNGEILQAAIETNYNENAVTISTDEAKALAMPVLQKLYPDSEATIESCAIGRGTFFEITGTLYKVSEESTREFGMTLNSNGELCAIIAPYDALDVVGASDELISKVLSYSQIEDVELELTNIETSGDDKIYTIALNGKDSPTLGDQIVRINASDLSLMEYTSRLGKTDEKLTMDDADFKNLVLKYIADYYPQFSYADIIKTEKGYSDGSAIAEAVGWPGQIYVAIWADGSLETIKLLDNTQESAAVISTDSDDIVRAKEKLFEYYYDLTYGKDMTFVRMYNEMDNADRTVYEFEYISKNPSIRDYSFVASVIYDSEHDLHYVKINPVLEELNIISEDEAIEIARGIVSKEQGIAADKLELNYFNLMEMSILYYEISFIYDHTAYGVRLYADTGEPEVGSELSLD